MSGGGWALRLLEFRQGSTAAWVDSLSVAMSKDMAFLITPHAVIGMSLLGKASKVSALGRQAMLFVRGIAHDCSLDVGSPTEQGFVQFVSRYSSAPKKQLPFS